MNQITRFATLPKSRSWTNFAATGKRSHRSCNGYVVPSLVNMVAVAGA